MQKELSEVAEEGFAYRAQTVFNTTFGGDEVVVIMERDPETKHAFEYRLLATSKTSTMQKELNEMGQQGFSVVGVTVGQTSFGGKELVAITARPKP